MYVSTDTSASRTSSVTTTKVPRACVIAGCQYIDTTVNYRAHRVSSDREDQRGQADDGEKLHCVGGIGQPDTHQMGYTCRNSAIGWLHDTPI
jgi:hypothetical protein